VPGAAFVGREREMAGLEAALDAALAGRSRLVMLSGEPGIGKSRTAAELAIWARARGALVLTGRCDEREGGAPPDWLRVGPTATRRTPRACARDRPRSRPTSA
jgi:predicted ATPase